MSIIVLCHSQAPCTYHAIIDDIIVLPWFQIDINFSIVGEKVLASSTNGRIPLTSLEETRLKESTRDRLNQEQLNELIDLVSQIHLKQIELEAEKTESMRKSLVDTLPSTMDEETIENILLQWQMIQKRIFYYQEVAARSYFTFIKLNEGSKEQRVISATLRLLQVHKCIYF